jgi:acyl carrier protein
MMNTEETLARYLLDELLLGSGRGPITPDESLIAGGILDSMALIRLIHFVEATFGITVGNGDIVPENFQTLRALRTFIEGKQGTARTAGEKVSSR